MPSDLWCRDVRLPGLQNVADLMDTSAQKYSIKDTVFTNQAIFRMSCSANVEFKLTEDNKNLNLQIIFLSILIKEYGLSAFLWDIIWFERYACK